jgi:hypothetical protein
MKWRVRELATRFECRNAAFVAVAGAAPRIDELDRIAQRRAEIKLGSVNAVPGAPASPYPFLVPISKPHPSAAAVLVNKTMVICVLIGGSFPRPASPADRGDCLRACRAYRPSMYALGQFDNRVEF